MRNILQDPLLHFLLFGAVIYVASTFFIDASDNKQLITVSTGQVQHLKTLFKKTWQRPPSSEEVEGIVNDYVLEQAAYLEGVRLGLDRDDIVIKRRLRQKIDFIAEESVSRPQATDEQLNDYLMTHSDQFRLPPTLTLRQVYLDQKTYGESLNQKAGELLAVLKGSPEQDITQLGNRTLFEPRYQSKSSFEITRLLGTEFSRSVIKLEPESWYGPIRSSYGLHLVYIESKQMGRLPELSEIRSEVIREWGHDQRGNAIKTYYSQLLSRFQISIEWPKDKTAELATVPEHTLLSKSSE